MKCEIERLWVLRNMLKLTIIVNFNLNFNFDEKLWNWWTFLYMVLDQFPSTSTIFQSVQTQQTSICGSTCDAKQLRFYFRKLLEVLFSGLVASHWHGKLIVSTRFFAVCVGLGWKMSPYNILVARINTRRNFTMK